MSGAEAERAQLARDLTRLANGEEAALARVYRRTAPKLYGICLRIVRDRHAAEDVLQETYLKVWHHAGRYDPDRASPVTWLAAIARNTAIDRRRALATANALHDPDPPEAEPVDDAASPEADAQWAEDARRLHGCIDALDTREAHAIRAAFLDGWSHSELAARLAVPLGTMKSRIRRGMLHLRECLDG